MLKEQLAPPSGFAALAKIEKIGKLAGFVVLIAYLLFLTSVEQLFVIQVYLYQSFNGKFGVKYSRIALIYQYYTPS